MAYTVVSNEVTPVLIICRKFIAEQLSSLSSTEERFGRPQILWYVNVVAQLVEALRYKPKGRGFDSGRNITLDLTKLLTEMSTRNISWGVKAAVA
jgi:hypothetical protein